MEPGRAQDSQSEKVIAEGVGTRLSVLPLWMGSVWLSKNGEKGCKGHYEAIVKNGAEVLL